jgi:unsaturated rhamnogalacturonyl hydrolase
MSSPTPSNREDAIPATSGPTTASTRPWLPENQLKPAYPVPYGPTTVEAIRDVACRILGYLETCTPTQVIDGSTGATITDFSRANAHADLAAGAFRLISYEWGATYSAMLQASEALGDPRFRTYATSRLQFIADRRPYFEAVAAVRGASGAQSLAFRSVIAPRNLDDAGSMGAAFIKAHRAGLVTGARPLIERYLQYITTQQFRLADGTLARNRPVPRTLWLDDLYMSVPALAQMALLTGDHRYFDDAVLQVKQFAARMFNRSKGLYFHGWIEEMDVHPEFHWGRCNGWALLAKTELLDVLPESHPGRKDVLDLLRRHIRGLAERQSGQGLWHQLLDRNDTYLETSCTAIFVYCIARAVNCGWIDALAHGPVAKLGWNALAAKVNAVGQVEGTCVGSGLALDPMFYQYRPTSPLAAHGYGPTLLAAAEMVKLTQSGRATMHDSALHFGETQEEA